MGDATKVIVEDPIEVKTKTADGSGRLFLGKDLAGKEITYVISEVNESDE